MNRTHNEFGQALAPWAVRREVADMVLAMRARNGARMADSQAKDDLLFTASHNLARTCAGTEIVADATTRLSAVELEKASDVTTTDLDVVTVSDLDVVILSESGEDQTDGEETTRGKQGPQAAAETADVEKLEGAVVAHHEDDNCRRRTRSASKADSGEFKKRRVDSVLAVTRVEKGICEQQKCKSEAFCDSSVLVVHKDLPCSKCGECSGIQAQLAQLGVWCKRLQLLTHKQNSAKKSALDFLEERSTFVLVHQHASKSDVISFLTLENEKQLAHIKLLKFEWASDSSAANQLLPDDRYKWEPKSPPSSSSQTSTTTLPLATSTPSAESGKPPANLGINLHPKPLGSRKLGAEVVERAVGGGSGLNGSKTAASDTSNKAAVSDASDVVIIIDDDGDDELFGGECDANGWRRSYGSSSEDEGGGGGGGGAGNIHSTPHSRMKNSKSEELLAAASSSSSARNFLPPLQNSEVASCFLVGKAKGQGRELTSAEVEALGGGKLNEKLNEKLISILIRFEEEYKALGGRVSPTDKFRAVAYRVAAEAIRRVKVELTLDNYEEELTKVGGRSGGGGGGKRVIGEKVRTKIREFLLSGRVEKLSVLTDDPKALVMKELQEVWGIGPTMAEKLVKSGVTGVKDLVGKTLVGEVKLTQQIQTGVEHHTDIMKKIPRAEIAEIADEFQREARRVGGDRWGDKVVLEVCGSYRRGKASSGDVDCLVTVRDCNKEGYSAEVVHALMERMKVLYGERIKTLMSPDEHCFGFQKKDKKQPGCCTWMGLIQRQQGGPWRRFDVKAYPFKCYPYALLHMTGSDHFNRSMRKFAWLKDLSLSDHGLTRVHRVRKDGKWDKIDIGNVDFPATTEEQVFDLLHLDYVPPHDRHSGYTAAMLQ